MRKAAVTAMMAVVLAWGIATGAASGNILALNMMTHPPDPCRAAVMSVVGSGRQGGHCLNPQPLPPG